MDKLKYTNIKFVASTISCEAKKRLATHKRALKEHKQSMYDILINTNSDNI